MSLPETFRLLWDCGVALKNQPLDHLMGYSGTASLTQEEAFGMKRRSCLTALLCSLAVAFVRVGGLEGLIHPDMLCTEPSVFPCSYPSYACCHQTVGETTCEEQLCLPTWMGYPEVVVGDADTFCGASVDRVQHWRSSLEQRGPSFHHCPAPGLCLLLSKAGLMHWLLLHRWELY